MCSRAPTQWAQCNKSKAVLRIPVLEKAMDHYSESKRPAKHAAHEGLRSPGTASSSSNVSDDSLEVFRDERTDGEQVTHFCYEAVAEPAGEKEEAVLAGQHVSFPAALTEEFWGVGTATPPPALYSARMHLKPPTWAGRTLRKFLGLAKEETETSMEEPGEKRTSQDFLNDM
ncbi:uncharacterized protein [Dermacentor albipictus]|uniref:uncharacterized protein n=1 Tax=Dermacentor albipictus TaxID=60249 RepID=UPI0038FBFADA